MITYILNIGSVVTGLLSLIFALIAMSRYGDNKRGALWSLFSCLCCILTVLFQLFEVAHRVNIGDISAIQDTINVIAIFAGIFVVGLSVINALAYKSYTKENKIQR